MIRAGIAGSVATRAPHALVLSLFPGLDLMGQGFEAEGFSVVRGPDLIYGGDIRRFRALAGRFDGVIAGSPCPDFSCSRRAPPTGDGLEMIGEFVRVVTEARPAWWWLENVPAVPDVVIPGYSHLRIDLRACDYGLQQRRLRHLQFCHRDGLVPLVTRRARAAVDLSPAALASEASRPGRRGFSDFCELMGLPRELELPGWTLAARYRAVGNGFPLPMARAIAAATRELRDLAGTDLRLCACGCARLVAGRRELATVACRKRAQRKRDRARDAASGRVTWSVTQNVTSPARPPAGASHQL